MPNKGRITQDQLSKYRNKTNRFDPKARLLSETDAVSFVDERGFVFFWPINGIQFPSLWGAVAGNRPVPNFYDDPGHITWRWKDNLLSQRKWFYAKVLRRKSTIISMSMIVDFFACSDTVNQGPEDLEYLYRLGRISKEEHFIFDLISEQGPHDTVQIKVRLVANPACAVSKFDHAMALLQRDLHILPIGLTESGRWHYSYLYDTVQHYYPALIEKSRNITKKDARKNILMAYFRSNGAGSLQEIRKLLQWNICDVTDTLNVLMQKDEIVEVILEDGNTEAYALYDLI